MRLILFCTLALLLASYLGALHPLGDSLAVFRIWLAAAVFVFSFALIFGKARRFAQVGLLAAVASAAPIILSANAGTAPSDAAYSLYQKNLYFNVDSPLKTAIDIRASNPDFVTLQELASNNRRVLTDLKRAYPSMQFCPFVTVGGTAVLSRWPRIKGSEICADGYGLAGMQVETPDGPVWVLSVHLHWPYPYGQAEHVKILLPMIEALDGPVVIAGDFNMVPWSSVVRKFGRATGTTRAGHVFATMHQLDGLVPLPIDHVLTPGGNGTISARPKLGSDHLGVLATFEIKG